MFSSTRPQPAGGMWRRRRTTSPTGLFPRNSQSLDCWISATPSASAARSFSFPCPICLFMSRGMDMDLPTVYHHFSRIFPLSRSQASDSVREAGSPFTVKQMKGHYTKPFPQRSVTIRWPRDPSCCPAVAKHLQRIDVVAVGGHQSHLGYGGILRAPGPTISHHTAGSDVQHRADAAGGVQSLRRCRRNRLPGSTASLLGPCAVFCQRRFVRWGRSRRLIPNGIGDPQTPSGCDSISARCIISPSCID